jgi:hypothetical protein
MVCTIVYSNTSFSIALSPPDSLRHTSCSGHHRKCVMCGEDGNHIRNVGFSIHYTNNTCVICRRTSNRDLAQVWKAPLVLRNIHTWCRMGTAQRMSNTTRVSGTQLQRCAIRFRNQCRNTYFTIFMCFTFSMANCLTGSHSRMISIFILPSIFWKNRIGLWDHVAVRLCVCVCLCIPLIVATQRLGKNPRIVARQRLGRNVTAVTNTHTTIEELLGESFSVWPVSYQGK